MQGFELILGLLVAIVALATLSRQIHLPYPIVFVLGGLAFSLIPGLPEITLEPDIVFLIFLPPLLYSAAWTTSWRDFWANRRAIGLLAIGLVIATTVLIAVVAHMFIPGFSWAAAFVLGAVVSPTDSIAATAIAQRLEVPRRLITIIEGESLVNDATGLVALRFAVAALGTGVFSLFDAGAQFGLVSAGGIIIGLGFGWLATKLERLIDDSQIGTTLSFLVPFAAYLTAERLDVSGVLAVVAAGLYAGRKSSRAISSNARLQAYPVWDVFVFLLNGLIFILIGLQLRSIVLQLRDGSFLTLLSYGAIVSLAVILIRIIWIFPATYLPRWLIPNLRRTDPAPPWQAPVFLSWTGMRGGVSLAAALALPEITSTGAPFTERTLILFLTFCVIVSTVVLQGLTLPTVIKLLGLGHDDGDDKEELAARLAAAQAALVRIDQLSVEEWVPQESLGTLQIQYQHHLHRFTPDDDEDESALDSQNFSAMRRLKQELIEAERAAIIALRDGGTISDNVLHRIERELDLQRVWLESGG